MRGRGDAPGRSRRLDLPHLRAGTDGAAHGRGAAAGPRRPATTAAGVRSPGRHPAADAGGARDGAAAAATSGAQGTDGHGAGNTGSGGDTEPDPGADGSDRVAADAARDGQRAAAYADSQVKALRGVGVSQRGPGVQRQVTSDSNGVVSLGKLGPGRHELTVNPRSLGAGTQPGAQPVALVGLLLPAVQKVRDGEPRYRTVVVRPVNDPPTAAHEDRRRRQRPGLDRRPGQRHRRQRGYAGDVDCDGRADIEAFEDLATRNTSGETRLVFVTPVPGSNAAALADANAAIGAVSTTRLGTSPGNPGGPGKPNPNHINNPIPGVDIIVEKNPSGGAARQTTGGDGTTTLGVLTPGTHSVRLDTKKLLDVRTPGPSGSEPVQPAGILIALLIPAVAKLGEAPQPTTVEHTFPRSVLANAKELRIDIVVPDGGGSPKVNWGDGSPTTDVGRDGVPVSSALRVSADVSTIRVQNYLSSPQTGPGGPGTPTANEAAINTTRSNIKTTLA